MRRLSTLWLAAASRPSCALAAAKTASGAGSSSAMEMRDELHPLENSRRHRRCRAAMPLAVAPAGEPVSKDGDDVAIRGLDTVA